MQKIFFLCMQVIVILLFFESKVLASQPEKKINSENTTNIGLRQRAKHLAKAGAYAVGSVAPVAIVAAVKTAVATVPFGNALASTCCAQCLCSVCCPVMACMMIGECVLPCCLSAKEHFDKAFEGCSKKRSNGPNSMQRD